MFNSPIQRALPTMSVKGYNIKFDMHMMEGIKVDANISMRVGEILISLYLINVMEMDAN